MVAMPENHLHNRITVCHFNANVEKRIIVHFKTCLMVDEHFITTDLLKTNDWYILEDRLAAIVGMDVVS